MRYIELAGSACGGPNDYTRRMRDGLEQIRRIMRACSNDFGRRNRPR